MRSSNEKIIKDTGYLLGGSLVGRFFSGIAGIITARVLGPNDYGLLKIINYIPSLAKYGSFGFGSVAKRKFRISEDLNLEKMKKKNKKCFLFIRYNMVGFHLITNIFLFIFTSASRNKNWIMDSFNFISSEGY